MFLKCIYPLLIAYLSISFCGCAAQYRAANQKKLFSLTVQDVKKNMIIKDDELETTVNFSTAEAFRERVGLANVVWHEAFLRAILGKKIGAKKYQVYVILRHMNRNSLRPYQANYGKPLITKKVENIHYDVDCSYASMGVGCKHIEHLIFNLEEKEVLRVINKAAPEDFKNKVWRFRIKNQAGPDVDYLISLPEFVGLYEMVESYKPIETQ